MEVPVRIVGWETIVPLCPLKRIRAADILILFVQSMVVLLVSLADANRHHTLCCNPPLVRSYRFVQLPGVIDRVPEVELAESTRTSISPAKVLVGAWIERLTVELDERADENPVTLKTDGVGVTGADGTV